MSEPSPLPDGADEHTEVLDDHEHTPGMGLAGDIVIIRYPDDLVSVTIDGVDFPWFLSKDPGLELLAPTEERPYPVVFLPVLCRSVEVRDAVPEGEAEQDEPCCEDDTACEVCDEPLEGVVVHHPEGDE